MCAANPSRNEGLRYKIGRILSRCSTPLTWSGIVLSIVGLSFISAGLAWLQDDLNTFWTVVALGSALALAGAVTTLGSLRTQLTAIGMAMYVLGLLFILGFWALKVFDVELSLRLSMVSIGVAFALAGVSCMVGVRCRSKCECSSRTSEVGRTSQTSEGPSEGKQGSEFDPAVTATAIVESAGQLDLLVSAKAAQDNISPRDQWVYCQILSHLRLQRREYTES